MTSLVGVARRPGSVTPEDRRRLLEAKSNADASQQEYLDVIRDVLNHGGSLRAVAQELGVPHSTIQSWMK